MTSPAALVHDVIYHIYNRGVNRENIFVEERNYTHFLNLYAKYIEPLADTYAYCLLRNHFHVLVRIKYEEEIQHPFGRVPVIQSEQLYRVVMYIHQNPQKHKFVEDFREWKYSSYGTLLSITPTCLHREQVMDWFNDRGEFESLHMDWISESESAGFAADDVD